MASYSRQGLLRKNPRRALKIIMAVFRGPDHGLMEQKIVSGTLHCPRTTLGYPLYVDVKEERT
jgi:hypothetical protein